MNPHLLQNNDKKFIKILTKFSKINLPLTLDIFLLLILFVYYLLFVNRGIVLGDEGYSIHIGERLLRGEIPYKDFFLQYPPGFFYLLSITYSLFGASILSGKLLTLFICLAIYSLILRVLKIFELTSAKDKIISLLIISSYGFPLINIPVVVWPTVLLTVFLMLAIFKKNNTSVGILISLLFITKQNIAITEMIIVNIITYLQYNNLKLTIKSLAYINLMWIFFTIVWIYYFFIRDNNISGLVEFLNFNKRYLSVYPFSYPPLSYLLQPGGLFKLIPYYLPIIFLFNLLHKLLYGKLSKKLSIFLLPLTGFFTTIYPTSDLLHVYPYYGVVLVCFYIFIKYKYIKNTLIAYIFLILSIISGFYLTFFREYYRYQTPYKNQNTQTKIAVLKGIYIDQNSAENIQATQDYLHKVNNNDYIFVYSFSPLLYSLLGKNNPSRYAIYFPGYLSEKEEFETITDIKDKHVNYIISDGFVNSDTPLTKWILSHKKVMVFGNFDLYKVN